MTTGTLHEDLRPFITGLILLRITFSDKSCRENKNTHFMFNNLFFSENRAIYEITWKDSAQPNRIQMKI
jgi:hypothetical protein